MVNATAEAGEAPEMVSAKAKASEAKA